jgi:simple sugar transport system ATP-binding protein
LLDEPTAVLAPDETDQLLRWLRRFAESGGSAVLIIHKLREALAAADDVTVLRRGRTVHASPTNDTSESDLAAAMLGEQAPRSASPPAAGHASERGTRSAIVTARNLELRDERGAVAIRGASFEIHGGELVGIAAVEGAGQRELLLALADRLPPAVGELALPSVVGFVPEDRHRDGMILEFTLAQNVALRGASERRGAVDWRDIEAQTREMIQAFDVRGVNERRPERTVAGQLSGGNQQKLVLARELAGAPALLVAENPTRGLDIRATAAVHDRLRAVRDGGSAVVVYSSDLDEVLGLADRVLVVHGGRVREVEAHEAAGRAMLGLE